MNNDATFITSSLPLAAYILAGEHLALREIRLTSPKSAELAFDDPQGRGREIERQFMTGAVVPALLYSTEFRNLRRAIDEKIFAARSSGDSHFKGRNYNDNQQLSR